MEVLRLDDQVCPHCGRELQAEWVEFPPALQKKYGKPGEWYYHPCTPECEKKNEQREWELMRRDARVGALKERSGSQQAHEGLHSRQLQALRQPRRRQGHGEGRGVPQELGGEPGGPGRACTSAATWGRGRPTSRSL